MAFGRRIYSLGVMGLGMVSLVWGDFVLGQPVPKGFHSRTAMAYAVGAFMFVAGAAVECVAPRPAPAQRSPLITRSSSSF